MSWKMTRAQTEVAGLIPSLPALSARARLRMCNDPKWERLAQKIAGQTKAVCSECLAVVDIAGKKHGDKVECPECGRTLKVKTRGAGRRSAIGFRYYRVLDAVKGWQVERICEVSRTTIAGQKPEYGVTEVAQIWYKDGHKVYNAMRASLPSMYASKYCWSGDMQIRKRESKGIAYTYGEVVSARMSPELRRIGLTSGRCVGRLDYHVPTIVELLTKSCPILETALKCGKPGLRRYVLYYGYKLTRWARQVKLAVRHGYDCRDWGMWADYLQLIKDEGRDMGSPKWVFPRDLTKAHDDAVRRKNAREAERARREELERERRDAEVARCYEERMKALGGFILPGEGFSVVALTTVPEVFEEGEVMHHCVAANRYYAKEDSILLSARTDGGERLETVEVSRDMAKVLQSRGVCNKFTERHEDIVSLVEKNMNRILNTFDYDSERVEEGIARLR